jgi:hypothetical protein
MSDEINSNTGQVESKVTVTPEECRAALDFWTHFKIPAPQSLVDAIERFSQNPTLENQDIMKLEICKSIAETDHEAFKDQMFQQIVQECAGVSFEMQFDKDVEKTLSEE